MSNLTFEEILPVLKSGSKVSREAWGSDSIFIVLMPALHLSPYSSQGTYGKVNDRTAKWIGEDTPLNCKPYIAMATKDHGWQPGWLASQEDLLANDWKIV